MARFQRFIPVLLIVFMVLLGGAALFIDEVRTVRAAAASAASQYDFPTTDAASYAGTLSTLVDMPGSPY